MQSEDYEDGGVLTALRRRWIAVGGFVGLAAEAAQPPPLQAPDECQPEKDSGAESDAGSQALHAAAYRVCDLLREIGGPGSAAATGLASAGAASALANSANSSSAASRWWIGGARAALGASGAFSTCCGPASMSRPYVMAIQTST